MKIETRTKKMGFIIVIGLMLMEGLASGSAAAAENFEYPELAMVPRASERIDTEAKREGDRRFVNYLPIQASALTTLVAGVFQLSNTEPLKDPDKRSPSAGLAVGGGWLALTTLLALYDTPYTDAAREAGASPRKTVREQLTRERMAEAAIRRRGKLGFIVRVLSTATNFAASAYMLSNAAAGSFSKTMNGVSAAVAFAPLIFRTHWEDVADEQIEYKKRIYAPVASAGLFRQPVDGKIVPGLQLRFQF